MEYPKFILTSTGNFRLGRVHLHKDLLQAGEHCYGGGFYEFDYVSNRLILSGESYDFGRPRWEWFDTLRVPEVYRGLRIVYLTHDGEYIVNEEIEIEYV